MRFPSIAYLRIVEIYKLLRSKENNLSSDEGRSRERYRRAALSSLSDFAGRSISIVLGFITVPLTINYLGSERYGMWMTVASVSAFIGLGNFGLGLGLQNAITNAHAENDQERIARSVSTVVFLLLLISVALASAFTIVYPLVAWERFFNVNSELASSESGVVLAIIVGFVLIDLPLSVVRTIHIAYQESFVNNSWQILGSALSFIALLTAIALKASLPWLVFLMSIGRAFANVANGFVLFVFKRTFLFPQFRNFDWGVARPILGASFVLFILSLLSIVGTTSDNLVISTLLGPSEVARFSVPQKLFSISMVFPMLVGPLWPAFGDALARKDVAWAKRAFKRFLILLVGIALTAGLPLALLGNQIIGLWVGSQWAVSGILLFCFLLWLIVYGPYWLFATFLNNGALVNKQLILLLIATAVSIALKIMLVKSPLGTAGILLGNVVGYGVCFCLPAAYVVRSSLRALQ